MPKLQTISTNFTAGEQSPRLRGRVDLEKYNASAEELYNCVVLKQGGVTIRPPTKYIGEIKTSSQTARIVPFVYSRNDAYLLEFGNAYMRVWKNSAAVESSPSTPYEISTTYSDSELADIDYSQGADTMLIAHSANPVQSLKRFADARWTMGDTAFSPAPVAEMGDRNAGTMTISNVAVGAGRTLTAGSAFFLAADVGRRISWGGGIALITAVGSSTSATATVETAFGDTVANGSGGAYPVWLLEGSPMASCTPSAATPLGASITLTLGAAGWRSDIVNGVIDVNGGLVLVTSYSSDTVITGTIVKVLTGTTAAPADAWVQKKPVFNATDGYAKAVSFYQQRTWLANTARFPQTKWGSKSGLYFDFTPGVDDDSAVYKTLDSDDANPIEYLHSGFNLVVMTLGGEFECKGGIEKPITQTNEQTNRQTRWGCDRVRPEQVGDDLVFMQRGGQTMRAVRTRETGGFVAPDISVFSEHLMRQGVKSMAFEQTPESILWVATTDGKLLGITYNSEQNTIAFCSGDVGGVVEWVATIPEGGVDATYLLVKRTINGATKRYIEKIDWGTWTDDQEIRNAHDCRMEKTGAAAMVWSGFDHLEGVTVSVLADDIYVGDQAVTSGDITLTRNATKVSVGIPYEARIKQQAPEVSLGTGTSQGQAVSVNKVQVRFYKSIGGKVNGTSIASRQFDVTNTLDNAPVSYTGIKDMNEYGWANGESQLILSQDQPYPWQVLGIIREVTINPG